MELVSELAYCGKHVIVDGLNMDYRGKEFGYIGGLLAMADDIEKLSAFCAVCGSPDAAFTRGCQRRTRHIGSGCHDWRFGGLRAPLSLLFYSSSQSGMPS